MQIKLNSTKEIEKLMDFKRFVYPTLYNNRDRNKRICIFFNYCLHNYNFSVDDSGSVSYLIDSYETLYDDFVLPDDFDERIYFRYNTNEVFTETLTTKYFKPKQLHYIKYDTYFPKEQDVVTVLYNKNVSTPRITKNVLDVLIKIPKNHPIVSFLKVYIDNIISNLDDYLLDVTFASNFQNLKNLCNHFGFDVDSNKIMFSDEEQENIIQRLGEEYKNNLLMLYGKIPEQLIYTKNIEFFISILKNDGAIIQETENVYKIVGYYQHRNFSKKIK